MVPVRPRGKFGGRMTPTHRFGDSLSQNTNLPLQKLVRKDIWAGRSHATISLWRDALYWYGDIDDRVPLEAEIHRVCCENDAEHVVKLRGWGVDISRKAIHLYMDNAPYGSLDSLIKSGTFYHNRTQNPLPEPVCPLTSP